MPQAAFVSTPSALRFRHDPSHSDCLRLTRSKATAPRQSHAYRHTGRRTPLVTASAPPPKEGPDPIAEPARERDPLLVDPLGPPKVVCFGETLCDNFSASPTAAEVDDAAWTQFQGGCPANVATVLVALGTSAAMVGNVGGDDTGAAMRSRLQARGVNVDGVAVLPGAATRRVFVRTGANGEREFVGYGGANAEFADALALDVDAVPGVLFYAASVFVTGTMGLAFGGSGAALREMVSLAALCKLCVVVDMNWRPGIWAGWADGDARYAIRKFLQDPGIAVVKGSVDDIAFVYGEDVSRDALDAPVNVLDAIGGRVRGVLVTAGERGASYAFRDVGTGAVLCGHVDAVMPCGGAVDTTGAGDAFVAGFVAALVELGGEGGLSNGAKLDAMVKMGASTASFVVQALGSTQNLPGKDEADALKQTLNQL